MCRLKRKGDLVLTHIDGQNVDSWSDPRLPSGGAGVLSARAYDPRFESVRLTVLSHRSPVEVGYWYLPGTYLGLDDALDSRIPPRPR